MSFFATHLAGFGVSPTSVLIDRTLGTNIGNCTAGAGLAAAFDGDAAQAVAASARSNGLNPGWIGKYWAGVARRCSRVTVISPNVQNFNGGNASGAAGTIKIYGKVNGQATTSTDGVLLYTAGFTDGAIGAQTTIDITTGITDQASESVFIRIDFGANTGYDVNVAELIMYEWI